MKKGFFYRLLSKVYLLEAKACLCVFPVNKSYNSDFTAICFIYNNLDKLIPRKALFSYTGWTDDRTIFQVSNTNYYVHFLKDWDFSLLYAKDISQLGNSFDIGSCSLKSRYDSIHMKEVAKRIQDWYIDKYGERE